MIGLEWMEDGVCRSVGTELWFPDQGDGWSAKKARAICQGCPSKRPCLEFALRNNERHGIWGGASERDRRKMAGSTEVAA